MEQVSLRAVVFAGSCTDLGTHRRSVKWGQGKGQQGKNELPSTGYPLQVLRKKIGLYLSQIDGHEFA